MSIFYMLVGAARSGKTSWAKRFAEEAEKYNKEAYIVSSDSIREELYGDESIQGNPSEVFELAHNRIMNALRADYDFVVFDATNIKRKNRLSLMKKIKKFDCEKHCLVFAEPYHVLINRNRLARRFVPEEVIWNMIKNFEVPLYSEGYDKITLFNKNTINVDEYVKYMRGFDQQNSHHSMSLLDHCLAAGRYITDKTKGYTKNEYGLCATSALLHDIGKVFTKTHQNMKGEDTEEAHYYNHQNVGAYLALLFKTDWTEEERLFITQLVCYHMQPYFNKTEAARRRWKENWGDKLNDMIMLLHEADEYAH